MLHTRLILQEATQMAEDRLKLPGSSYDELVKIIKAYFGCRGLVGPTDVAHRAAMDRTVVSRNNAFLVGIGVIHGGRKKELTEAGRTLASALDHNQPDDIQARWREIIAENEFFEKVVSAVRIRKGMEPSNLKAHIAYSAGEPRSRRSITGAGAVAEILVAAGLIREEEGKLVAVPRPLERMEPSPGSYPPGVEVKPGPGTAPACTTLPTVIVHPPTGVIRASVQVEIQIQCSAADIDDLTPKVRQLLDAIRAPSAESSDQSE
jgi:hypothetical protein